MISIKDNATQIASWQAPFTSPSRWQFMKSWHTGAGCKGMFAAKENVPIRILWNGATCFVFHAKPAVDLSLYGWSSREAYRGLDICHLDCRNPPLCSGNVVWRFAAAGSCCQSEHWILSGAVDSFCRPDRVKLSVACVISVLPIAGMVLYQVTGLCGTGICALLTIFAGV